jgi:ABC-2 type transport system permease protein
VNWEHLRAFVWLRWRLSVNQWRRGGAFNALLMIIVAVGLVVVAVPLFVACFALGFYAFPKAAPAHLLYAWDAMVVGFLFFWSIGLLTELQRTESLSLSKFLHLPVSVNSAFLINYVSSLLRLSMIVFAPVLFGFGLALAASKGVLLLSVLPLTVAFLLMVTGLTYQFQGWLASLMSNPRRRRTVVVVTTLVFVLIFQLPNLLRFVGPWSALPKAGQATKFVDELAALDRAFEAKEIDQPEYLRRQQEVVRKHQLAQDEAAERLQQTARLVNLVLPVGWLPLGVMYAAEGNVLPAILGTLAMTLVGAACLWRAYRTTIGLYRGQATRRKQAAAPATPATAKTPKANARPLETRFPGLSEPVSAIALASFRSLIRSPESKMMLLTPVILGAVFGSMILRSPDSTSDAVRTLFGIGAIGMTLFCTLQLMANQFGFDRDGFRVFVLCPAPRRDILLGKNLAFAPLALGMAAILVTVLQCVFPMSWDHYVSMVPQFVSMYLLFCVLMNLLSIYAPMHIVAGSLKPASPKLVPILLQFAMFLVLAPLTQAPTLLPLAVESVFEWLGWTARVPIYLMLSLVQCAAVVFIYRFALTWQGDLLRSREQAILDTVTNRAP